MQAILNEWNSEFNPIEFYAEPYIFSFGRSCIWIYTIDSIMIIGMSESKELARYSFAHIRVLNTSDIQMLLTHFTENVSTIFVSGGVQPDHSQSWKTLGKMLENN